jgi:hypothetical protein
LKSPCESVKQGIFHFYQDNGKYHSVVIRKDSIQTEVNLTTGDSTCWKISWISDCEFKCSFISGSKIKTQQEIDFYKTSILKFNIIKTTKEYYIYDASLTVGNDAKHFTDTMWLHPK